MKIKILYAGEVREIVGKREEDLEFNEKSITLNDVLNHLIMRYGIKFKESVYDRIVKGELILLVNGVRSNENLMRSIQDGDFISIVPILSGG